jgi:drug/metabolite transporter (DMT)-like permease
MDSKIAALRTKHWLAFVALGLIWGSTWVATDTLAEQVPPLFGAAVRFLLAALLLISVVLFKRLRLPRGRALGVVLLLSVTMIVVPFVLVTWARSHVPSATVAVSFAAVPLVVMILTPVFAGKEVPHSATKAAIVGLGSMALALGASLSTTQAAGAAVVLLAVASTGVSSLVARRELRGLGSLGVTALSLGAASPLLFLASMVLERGQSAQWNGRAVASVLFLAILPGAAAYATWFWLLQQLEAYQVATVQWVEPLVAVAEGAILLRLGLSLSMIVGSLITLVSLWVVMRARPEDDESVSLLGN